METFGTLVLRLYTLTPSGEYSRSKISRLHAFHGQRKECLALYAKWRKVNPTLADQVNATWEVREAIHADDLPDVED